MDVGIQQERPPYIRFEMKSMEDRTASLAAGNYVAKDVEFVLITPPGSKDCYEKEVAEWFKDLQEKVNQQRYPQAWFNQHREAYNAWKANEEIPLEGTPIKNWGMLSPAMRDTCLRAHILTVEILAGANEEMIGRLGMGGRALVQKAKEFLLQATPAKAAAQLEALRVANETLTTQNTQMQADLQRLTAQVNALSVDQGKTTYSAGVTGADQRANGASNGDPAFFSKI